MLLFKLKFVRGIEGKSLLALKFDTRLMCKIILSEI